MTSLEWPRYSAAFDDYIQGAAFRDTSDGEVLLQEKETAAPEAVVEYVTWLLPKGLPKVIKDVEEEGGEDVEAKAASVNMEVGDNSVVKKKPASKTKRRSSAGSKGGIGKRKGGFNSKIAAKKRRRKDKVEISVEEDDEGRVGDEDDEDGEDDVDLENGKVSVAPRARLSRACKKSSIASSARVRNAAMEDDDDDDDFQT